MDDATAVFDSLTATFPQLDPEVVLSALDGTLQQLLSGARDALGGFGVLAPFDAAVQLGAEVGGCKRWRMLAIPKPFWARSRGLRALVGRWFVPCCVARRC